MNNPHPNYCYMKGSQNDVIVLWYDKKEDIT